MTRDTRTGGRELDALVAEKVMGWTAVMRGNGNASGFAPAAKRAAFVPRYSTDIAAAWEVVEKVVLFRNCRSLCEAGVGIRDGESWTRTGWRWEVVQELGPDEFDVIAAGETAAIAICRAALEVVRELEELREMESRRILPL